MISVVINHSSFGFRQEMPADLSRFSPRHLSLPCDVFEAYKRRRLERHRVLRIIVMINLALASASPRTAGPRRNIPRIDWELFSAHDTDSEFQNIYRLERVSFYLLLSKIIPFVESDRIMASRSSSGPITPEIMLAITLRMCAGGRQQDLRRLYGVSRTSIYLTFHKVLEAIDHVESLFFPADEPDALAGISSGFDRLTDGLLAGCVGAVDGYAISIIKPTSQYCSNPAFYFNRKGYYSLNMQAVCDSHRRFLFVSILSAGSTHDSAAWELSTLAKCMDSASWPTQYWIAGDAAYSASENMITPYSGRLLCSREDSFNFYQSRIRINIECAFGLLWKTWLILQAPLQYSLPIASKIMSVLCKLQNIIITGRIADIQDASRSFVPQDDVATSSPGVRTDLHISARREIFADLLENEGWVRPAI